MLDIFADVFIYMVQKSKFYDIMHCYNILNIYTVNDIIFLEGTLSFISVYVLKSF